MPLEIRPLGKEHAPEAARLTIETYEAESFRAFIFPNGMGEDAIKKITTGVCQAQEDPDSFSIQIYDTDAGRMAAYAVWVYTKAMSDDDWKNETEELFGAFPEAPRQDVVIESVKQGQAIKQRVMGHEWWWGMQSLIEREVPSEVADYLFCTELCALNVLPKYQRRGLGSRLMKWGTEKIEQMKGQSIIIATEEGYGLYVKHGFTEVERMDVDLEQWGGHGRYTSAILTRELKDDIKY